MKIVHTYLKTERGGKLRETILQSMLLSTLLAKKFYNRVDLYTDRETEKIVREIGIPYTNIYSDQLDKIKVKSYTLPKVHTYTLMDEPYLHIDLDSFIFQRINELDTKTIWACYPEGGNELSFHIENKNFYHTYVQSAFFLQEKLPSELLPYVRFSNVPNFCIFGGYNHQLIADASRYALDIYKQFEEYFETDYYYAIMLEQLLIPSIIRMNLDKIDDIRSEKQTFNFFYEGNPTFINIDQNIDFKISFDNHGKVVHSTNEQEFYNLISYNHNGFLHLNGYKDFDEVVFLIRQRSIDEFNAIEQVKRIDDMFTKSEKFKMLISKYEKYGSIKTTKLI